MTAINGHGAMVAYGSPKPLIWVRILVPVLKKFNSLPLKSLKFKELVALNIKP